MNSNIENNKSIVRKLVRAMDEEDLSILDSVCAPNFTAHFMGADLSLAEICVAAAGFSTAFPDLRHKIQDLVAEGDRVVVRAIDTGNTTTYQGEYRGVPATNRTVKFETIAIYRIEKGKIAEVWQQMDVQSLMRQLGEGI